MKNCITIFALVVCAQAFASDPVPSWLPDWSAHVTRLDCRLQKRYYIPESTRQVRRGFLDGTVFDSAFMQFHSFTRTHGSIVTADKLGVIKFSLHIYPSEPPVRDEDKILSADLGGHQVAVDVVSDRDIHIFSLAEQPSLELMERFADNEVVHFALYLANGESRAFDIFPSGNRTFHVWADMFETCIRVNTDW